jgi:hypothetical protein
MWICPECCRKFARNKQSHSCIKYNPEDLFFGKGERTRQLYIALTDRVKVFGEVEIHAGKWGITIRRLSTFLSVLIEKNHLTLVFISLVPIDEFPVYQNYQHTSNRFSNSVKIESQDEIDDQLLGWLKQAWELAI